MRYRHGHTLLLLAATFLAACASIGTPDGGEYDMMPPKLIKATPQEKATGSKAKKIILEFDEIVQIENASEKVIVSPPQIEQAEIKASGKRITVELVDSLKPNTTYSIDFSDAIVDNNESNPMGNFAYTFSTGDRIDSMEVSGTVLNAEDLEPVKGILVGVHSSLEDSVFTAKELERVARTNSAGHFVIKGIAPGTYHIYALQDQDQDFKFSQKSEKIAFLDSLIVPSCKPDFRMDTIWRDSVRYDSIVPVHYTHFYPDNIVLRAFQEEQTDRYLLKNERPVPERFSLIFSSASDTLPRMRGLNFEATDNHMLTVSSQRNDTITCWLRDSALIRQDTLMLEMSYYQTDSLGKLANTVDTLYLSPKMTLEKIAKEKQTKLEAWQKEQNKRKKKGLDYDSIPPSEPLSLTIEPRGTLDPDQWIMLAFNEPLEKIDTSAIHLKVKQDTLWTEMPFELKDVETDPLKRQIAGEWDFGGEYQLQLDTLAFQSIYGKSTPVTRTGFKAKEEREYSTLFLSIPKAAEGDIVQLLDQDKLYKEAVVTSDRKAELYFIKPGKYYIRIIRDTDHNGKWTTGSFRDHRDAEMVFYYPHPLELKESFEISQAWDLDEQPLEKQKPDEIKTQKEEKKTKKRDRNKDREQAMRRRSQNSRNE